MVFYLNLDVVETNCSVLSKMDWKDCEPRPIHDTPVSDHTHRHTIAHVYNDVAFIFFLSMQCFLLQYKSLEYHLQMNLNQHVLVACCLT